MAVKFSYDSERARLARLHARIGVSGAKLLLLTSATLLWIGVLVLWGLGPIGWLSVALSLALYMAWLWDKRQLSQLAVEKVDALDGRLDVDTLALLPKKVSPKMMLAQLANVASAQFVMARAGLSPGLLADVVEDTEESLSLAFAAAKDIKPEGLITGADMIAAFAKSSQSIGQLLPHLQLDADDVVKIAAWHSHLMKLIDMYRKPRRTGGIARDLNFGYLHLLEKYGLNVSRGVAGATFAVTLESHTDALQAMKKTFSSKGGRQNVALVGPLGAGKTTIVHAFAADLLRADAKIDSSLKFRQVISLDAGTLIANASGRGQLEDLLNRLLLEAYHAKNVILCLDDADLFFEEGMGSVDLSNILLPILQNGAFRVILTMDEQRWLKISSRNPALAGALNKITVRPATESETLAVMQDQLINMEFEEGVTYMYQSLKESLRLSERFLYDQAQPGKALKILRAAANNASEGLVTAMSVQRAVEQMQGVKVVRVNDTAEKSKLLNMEGLIHERMINQTRAVEVVSDALRRARAGVRNEQKPVGTFLFLGPTGTGKTELAKSLAAVYFGGEEHMIRIDMNEFVSASDVNRLIADGANDPMSLTAQVMKQPFAVVLLDEIEKAHSSVLTALLQALDEGVLRDATGREVSFRDCIFIATSNAGSDQIRHHIAQGEELADFERELMNELIVSKEFRPEFLNRFDEIVLFKPLDKEELYQIVDLMISGTNRTLEPQKITIKLTDSAKDKLVELGYDPQLGARPLRRVLQRNVESLVAKTLLADGASSGQTITIDAGDIRS